MATAFAAVVFAFLLTFSSAHLPLDQPKNDFLSTDHSSVSLQDPNPKTGATILLPTERPETEPAETQPEETQLTDSKSLEKDEMSVQVSEFQTDSLPSTTVFTLRPVNRRFSRVPFFPIRRGYKCHGRHRHHRRFAGQGQISFGNDMIVAKDHDRDSDPAYAGDGQRPERWAKYNHGEKRFNDKTSKQEMYKMFHARPHLHHHRHNHRHHHGGEEHGIIYSIRKFLNF